jgi:excisionase family DNA binding protein
VKIALLRNIFLCGINFLMKGFLTTKQTADRLGISPARVRRLIIDGVIKAEKVGRDNFVSEGEVKRLESEDRKPGRPPKENK